MKQASKHREGSRQIRRHEKKGRTPAQRLLDSGALQKEERKELLEQLRKLNPFGMRKAIRELENDFWKQREELLEREREEALALVGAPPLRSRTPTRAIKRTTKNKVAVVS